MSCEAVSFMHEPGKPPPHTSHSLCRFIRKASWSTEGAGLPYFFNFFCDGGQIDLDRGSKLKIKSDSQSPRLEEE